MKCHKKVEILLMLALNTNQSLDIYKQNVNNLYDILHMHMPGPDYDIVGPLRLEEP